MVPTVRIATSTRPRRRFPQRRLGAETSSDLPAARPLCSAVVGPNGQAILSDRVNDDFVSAIYRAREIEQRIVELRSSGQGRKRLTHEELVQRHRADLEERANAGEIDPGTVSRYVTALSHYLAFCAARDAPA